MPIASEKPPPWKFWSPLSIWKVLLIFFLTNVVLQLIAVALREGAGLRWVSSPAAAGAAGAVGVMIISNLARKQRDAAANR